MVVQAGGDGGTVLEEFGPVDGPVLLVHGGAGTRSVLFGTAGFEERRYHEGLRRALEAGWALLAEGAGALDAVCAAVVVLEDDPLFNAGVGAALTTAGQAELDASVMTGDGRAGAVTVCRTARHPVLAARAVMERTPHVLLADPSPATVRELGVETAEPASFVTAHRRADLEARLRAGVPSGHGTVGAVAVDAHGAIAAATSTGGISGQWPGRVGDTPVLGAGTFADDASVAISTTGQGEFFARGVVAKDVADRVELAGASLADACAASIGRHLAGRGGYGGVIALQPSGAAVLAFNSAGMFRGRAVGGAVTTWV